MFVTKPLSVTLPTFCQFIHSYVKYFTPTASFEGGCGGTCSSMYDWSLAMDRFRLYMYDESPVTHDNAYWTTTLVHFMSA